MNFVMPVQILNILSAAGHEAFFVGGCVRDYLLGRTIHDWDITTSALPEETMSCFDHCVPTGIKHGTITVLLDDLQAEVTTYRTDGSYADGRHPDQVTFVRSLSEDLARRDFTINAMAMDSEGRITDLYGGQDDLRKRSIRCVGNPELRFREDALRMLRACRFSAQLGFSVEEDTRSAMERLADLTNALSVERIRDEVEKTLLSDHPEVLQDMANMCLLSCCDPDMNADCGWIAGLPKERAVRWAALCKSWPDLDPVRMRLEKRLALDAAFSGRTDCPSSRLEWKQLIAAQGETRTLLVAELYDQMETCREVLNSGECLSLRELAVNGNDLSGSYGKDTGKVLRLLLDHVLQYPEDNVKEILLKILQNSIDYCYWV